MEKNPYQAILSATKRREDPTAALTLGRVISAAPLRVLVGGNTLELGELLCNADLVREAEVAADLTGAGSVGDASGAVRLEVSGGVRRMNEFRAGDRLLLLPIEDAQRYIIICKVVQL